MTKGKKLSRVLIEKRMEKNLSIAEAAKEIGISYLSLWKIEDGYSQLSYETVKKIANFLGISVKEVRDIL